MGRLARCLVVLLAHSFVSSGCSIKYQADLDLPIVGEVRASNVEDQRLTQSKTTAAILQQKLATLTGASSLAAVVTSDQQVMEIAVVGHRSLSREDALSLNAPFHIGSIAKPFAATVIATLVQTGALAWDERLVDWFPQADPEYSDATLADLLSHQAGIQRLTDESELAGVPHYRGSEINQRQRVAEWLLVQPPRFPPGTQYEYSNGAFTIVAVLAERATGKDWETLVRSRLFTELGMNQSGFGWPDGEGAPLGHIQENGSVTAVEPDKGFLFPLWLAPAGDIHSSMGDMARFMQQYLKAWNDQPAMITRTTTEKLFTKRIKSGIGWGTQSFNGHDRVAVYEGSADSFMMMIALFLDVNRGVVVAANGADENTHAALVETLRALAPEPGSL